MRHYQPTLYGWLMLALLFTATYALFDVFRHAQEFASDLQAHRSVGR